VFPEIIGTRFGRRRGMTTGSAPHRASVCVIAGGSIVSYFVIDFVLDFTPFFGCDLIYDFCVHSVNVRVINYLYF